MKTKINKFLFCAAALMALVAAVLLPNSCNKPPKVETDRNLHILIPDPDETIYENSSIDDFLDSYEELIKPMLTIVLYLSLICLTVMLIFKLCRTMKNSNSKNQNTKTKNILIIPEEGTLWDGTIDMKYRLHEYSYHGVPMPEYFRIEYIPENEVYHIISAPIRKDRSFEVYHWNKFFEGKKTSKELLTSLGYGENIGIVFDTDGIQIYDKERFANYYYAFTFIYDVAVIYNKEKRASDILLDFIERMRQRINVEDVNKFTETVARHSAISNENLMELIKDDNEFEELHEYADYTSEKDPE